MIENGICGWVSFGAELASQAAPATRMLRTLAGQPVSKHIIERGGEAFAYGPAPNRAFARRNALAAIVQGRPWWQDPSLQRTANENNNADALITAYERDGPRFLSGIRGSFALALADTRTQSVILAIDRMGIERLCWSQYGETLAFGTNAKAVARFRDAAPQLCQQALFDYLYCHVIPSPETVFSGVEKLRPGECIAFDGKSVKREFYWGLRRQQDKNATLSDLEEAFRHRLRGAVAREGRSENTGAFLSGGTDSSTISGLLGEVSGQPARTFSMGFAAEGYDEMAYARIAARHFGTQSHEYYVTPDDVVEALPLIAQAYDEPFGNDSAAPTYFCARFAKQHGTSILLAGDGGDEMFGGNSRYAKQKIFEHYGRLPSFVRGTAERVLFAGSALTLPPPLRKLQSYVRQARIPLPDRLESYNFLNRAPLEQIFEREFLLGIDTERPLALQREEYFRTDSQDSVERMMHLDLKITLADNDLRKVCRMCEIAGVEARFPFLDDELAEFSGTIPTALKVRGTRLRYLFKRALKDFLPREILAKTKHGFGLPFGPWLISHPALARQVEAALGSFAGRGIVRPAYIDALWQQHTNIHATYFGIMIWVLTELELWLQHHGDNLAASG